jgi:hypothetical protein
MLAETGVIVARHRVGHLKQYHPKPTEMGQALPGGDGIGPNVARAAGASAVAQAMARQVHRRARRYGGQVGLALGISEPDDPPSPGLRRTADTGTRERASTVAIPPPLKLWRTGGCGGQDGESRTFGEHGNDGKPMILSRENGCILDRLVFTYSHERKRRRPGP